MDHRKPKSLEWNCATHVLALSSFVQGPDSAPYAFLPSPLRLSTSATVTNSYCENKY